MEENQNKLLKEPYNPTDPKVVFDPEYNNGTIVKIYDDIEGIGNSSKSSSVSAIKDDAINIPVIKMNNIVLKDNQIDFLKIFYNSFIPEIILSVKDSDNLVRTLDTPGYDNDISIVITTEINGYYKKINLQFYITKIQIFDEYISYNAKFKFQDLNKNIFKQIGKGKLNTYNMLKEIAQECKLGFASTKKCEDIKDDRYRLAQSQTYIDLITQHIAFSGIDEESIFDCWIDLFGYLVLINVPYVFHEKVDQEQLMIYSMVGYHSGLEESSEVTGIQLQRTLTNNKVNANNYNLLIENYEPIVNNESIYNDGALNENYYLTGLGNTNQIKTEQIQIIENSLDGIKQADTYEFKKNNFLGIEFDPDMPILFKTQLNKRYFDKLKSRKLKVELSSYNLGLERGTLVNVVIKEYNQTIIKQLNQNINDEESAEGVVNPYSSGIYYIDSMEFVYKIENHKIIQYLYLIKKGSIVNPLNKTLFPINDEK